MQRCTYCTYCTYYIHTNTHNMPEIIHNSSTATQMWKLARYLPLLIGALIEEEDEHWETYLSLLDILDICFSPQTNEQQVSHLTLLIAAHHESFKAAYPELCLTPKQHYMVHYPEWIRIHILYTYVRIIWYRKQVIRVKKTRGAAAPALELLGHLS